MTRRPRTFFLPAAVAAILLVSTFFGCGNQSSSESASVPSGWRQEVLRVRAKRDTFMASVQGPLTPDQRRAFTGLHYYPPDPSFRFVVPMDTVGAGVEVTGLDTRQKVRRYVVHSHIHLQKDGQRFTLTVLRPSGSDELFLPFQDATTGKETYDVGRYLDLSRQGPDSLVVDFNFAINPYCAYNDHWACPLVPPENRIPIAITAGERKFHD